jgi:hypothetical protein
MEGRLSESGNPVSLVYTTGSSSVISELGALGHLEE